MMQFDVREPAAPFGKRVNMTTTGAMASKPLQDNWSEQPNGEEGAKTKRHDMR